jgi:dTDP-4-amino-4,6-dideoxygalactose transaminase
VGATPVFVDIDPLSVNIDPECVRRAISPQTKAVMAVHFGGTMCEIAALERICQEHNLVLIEDAAHAHGSEWNGKRAGSFGLAGSFSFQNGKVLSAGEGGMLVTSDEEFARKARSFINCGRSQGRSFYEHTNLGTNFRLTAFQAAVLLAQFERLPQQIATRTAGAEQLKKSLEDVVEIVWQKEPPQCTQNSFYLLIGRTRSGAPRDEICRKLTAAGVPCTPFYPHTLYRNELYKRGGCRVTACPVAEQCVRDAFWLSHRALLADSGALHQMAQIIRAAVGRSVAAGYDVTLSGRRS